MTERKTIVITGGSDGIGLAAARQLQALGHCVVIVGRNKSKTEKTALELGAPWHVADFVKLSDVVRLAGELSAYPQIDVLANNAGAMMAERTVTQDGFERTFQVNVLGAFLLTELLKEKLCKDHATVIQTSSIAAKWFSRDFDVADLQTARDYTPVKAYGNSKLCNVLFTRELHRRYHEAGLCAVAFEPGIVRSNFAAEGARFFKIAYHTPLKYFFTVSPKSGAKRLVRLALGKPEKDFKPGEMYSYKKPYKLSFRDDGTFAASFWEQCETMLKIPR